jgi:hypothetical protein
MVWSKQVGTEGCRLRNPALMLLANVTATEAGARRMLQIREEPAGGESEGPAEPSIQGLHVRRLLRWFLGEPERQPDDWQHVASVLCNVSQLQEGRDLLRRRSTDLLRALLPQLRARGEVRRRGVANAIRNCCFEEGDHWYNNNNNRFCFESIPRPSFQRWRFCPPPPRYLMEELHLVPHLLRVLMGPDLMSEEDKAGMDPMVYDGGEAKEREPLTEVREEPLVL